MRKQDLIKGQEYVLTSGLIGTFDGTVQGDTALTFADGTTFIVKDNGLRFLITNHETGTVRLALVADGKGVEESVQAKEAREAQEAEKKAKVERIKAEATAILADVGLEVAENRSFTSKDLHLMSVNGEVEDIEVDNFTIGHLLQVIEAVEARVEHEATL